MNTQHEHERAAAMARIVAASRTAELMRQQRNAEWRCAMTTYTTRIAAAHETECAAARVMSAQRAKDCAR